ncbi:MAG: hypothetical protein PHN42_01865 [Bacilli bacterium]|nr:hypothetical protein [Bacilli bacterium]
MELITDPYDVVAHKIDYMMGHEDGIKEVFYYKRDRLTCSKAAILICDNDNDIGFLNVVDQGLKNLLFIDQGIIEKYRGKGYGSKALQILADSNIFKEYLICETMDNNILANYCVSKIGKFLFSYDDRNFYLLQSEKYNEFINSEEFNKLEKHIKGKRLIR